MVLSARQKGLCEASVTAETMRSNTHLPYKQAPDICANIYRHLQSSWCPSVGFRAHTPQKPGIQSSFWQTSLYSSLLFYILASEKQTTVPSSVFTQTLPGKVTP